MAIEHSLSIPGQPYFYSTKERMINVFYSEPETGVTTETGILLLISGFEGDTHANIYKKMRNEFADNKNLIVIQCDYFGFQFMGKETMQKVHKKMQNLTDVINQTLSINKELSDEPIKTTLVQEETVDDFCELGLFQALDNLKSLKAVLDTYQYQKIIPNLNQIIAYGYSHGAYLALLCNALAPNLFSGIIDNSGWIYPVYLYRPRICSGKWQDTEKNLEKMLYVFLEYKGRQWIDDLEIYNLRRIYSQFSNKAKIISFHGESDGLVPIHEKHNFIKKIPNAKLYTITNSDIDNKIFFNTQHGMGCNFLNLFYLATSIDSFQRNNSSLSPFFIENSIFTSNKYIYSLSNFFDITRIEKNKF